MTTVEMPVTTPDHLPQKPRRGRKILLWVLALAVIGVFGAIGFLLWADSQVEKIPADELAALTPVSSDTRNFLLVGTDSRENLPDDFEGKFGDFSGERTDVIMVAHVANGRAQLLSIPRDLRVEIPGRGTDKINAAFVFGGPDLLVETIQQNLDIPINHYVEIDFVGFANTVDALGGVTMTFPYDSRDLKSGFEIEAGTHTLNGEQALAFARSRSFEELQPDGWTTVEGNDIGRTGRQQELLLTMLNQAKSPSSAFNLPGFVSSFARQIRTDSGVGVGTMVELGGNVLGLQDGSIEAVTLPVTSLSEGGVSYVVTTDASQGVIFQFNEGQPLS